MLRKTSEFANLYSTSHFYFFLSAFILVHYYSGKKCEERIYLNSIYGSLLCTVLFQNSKFKTKYSNTQKALKSYCAKMLKNIYVCIFKDKKKYDYF